MDQEISKEKGSEDISSRKKEHIQKVLTENVQADYNYWDDIHLLHDCLPEIDFDDINTKIKLFGAELNVPLIVTGMVGGIDEAEKINRNLAEACAKIGCGMGVGSQRIALEKPETRISFEVLKEFDIPLKIANIGAPQIASEKKLVTVDNIGELFDMIEADILAIHLNYLQEAVQINGELRAKGVLKTIKEICHIYPCIAKETGAGISANGAQKLKKCGIKGFDISGVSGTSWAGVEYHIAKERNNKNKMELGKILWNWGIPAPVSVLEADVGLPIIASGGLRNGLDIARALVIGADCAGIARILLKSATESADKVVEQLEQIIEQLKIVMFLTNSKNIEELKKRKAIVTGRTKEWLEQMESL